MLRGSAVAGSTIKWNAPRQSANTDGKGRLTAAGLLHHGVDDVVVYAGFPQVDQVFGAGVEVGGGGANLAQDDLFGESGPMHLDDVGIGQHGAGSGTAIRRGFGGEGGAGTRLGFVDAGVAADVGGGFSAFFEGHVLALHPHQDGGGRDRGGYTRAAHIAFALFGGGAQGYSPAVGEAHGINAEFERAGASEAAPDFHFGDAAEGDCAFRDDHIIPVDDGFGDFEIHGLAHVRVGGGDGAVEAKPQRRAVLERVHLGGSGQDEEKNTGETHDELQTQSVARGLPEHDPRNTGTRSGPASAVDG